jgi:DNA-binding NarL/FixJ family response regulator
VSVPLKARILLADDHVLVREGLRLILDRQPDLEVVAEAGDGAEAIDRALRTELDLAVLDVSMPRLTGLQAARHLRAQRPQLKVLILSMHDNEQFFFEALKVGASGYVLKTAANEDLVAACRAALRGEPFLYPGAVRALIRDFLERGRSGEDVPEDPLTPPEEPVVRAIQEVLGEQLLLLRALGGHGGAAGIHGPGRAARGARDAERDLAVRRDPGRQPADDERRALRPVGGVARGQGLRAGAGGRREQHPHDRRARPDARPPGAPGRPCRAGHASPLSSRVRRTGPGQTPRPAVGRPPVRVPVLPANPLPATL